MPSFTSSGFSRRSFLRTAAGGALGIATGGALAACGGGSEAGSDGAVGLRAAWFGGDDRHKRTVKAFEIIQGKVPNTTIKTEYGGFDGYFDKLSTQISGGGAPDIVQMNFDPQLSDFALRNALTDLSKHVGRGLDLSALPQVDQANGKVADKVYGVSLGTLVPAVMVDTTALASLKLTAPTSWNWDSYADFALTVSQAGGGKVAGTEDASAYDHVLLVWLFHRGRPGIFAPDGSVAATEADVTEWFQYWEKLRRSGACVDIKVQAAHNNGDHPTNPLVIGKAALALQFSTTLGVWSGITKHTLAFAPMPDAVSGSNPGNYARPSALWSVPRGTKNVDRTVDVINTFINDTEVAKALGFTRAMPNANALKAIGTELAPAEKALIAHTNAILAKPLAPAPRVPKGGSETGKILKRNAEEVAFGRTTAPEAAKKFVAEIKAAVGK
ncbi:carbohydrate ABC transporter substrate-binding protein, CUT1 family [Micromonospora sediminicola]|uniref:Carbohydrate ABC transporter substrate-binding protein, CUT1 family n=1 Tax=Micromonospora sediminicola TaxID=946078 RepID=A0A1A9B8A4_9ACTN|nr:ABC transporter substrate-binding protein [Micromonospora sediminicola]SBT65765.1 carbohydrate ABC transporter substrate-binding protein, CUT1 family [Micromonospora sediminicola]